ncbi:MAG: thioredoxin, partial [Arenimonas sp.]
MNAAAHVFDATLATFEADVLQASQQQPVLIDFWATWCGPCKTLGPILEKLAAEYAGGFRLAKVDVDAEQQLAGYFQIKSIPTVMLVKGGEIVDGFPGALPEGQLREFLKHHGVEPRMGEEAVEEFVVAPLDPHAEVVRLRAAASAEPAKDELKLDLALALLQTGAAAEAEKLLDALPANLGSDDRAVKARARLGFAALLADAPPRATLEVALAADPADLRARH